MEFKTTLYGVETKRAPLHAGGLVKSATGPTLFWQRSDASSLAKWYKINMGVKARVVKVTSTHIWK